MTAVRRILQRMSALPTFDFGSFVDAFDRERQRRNLDWYAFAGDLWQQSAVLNERRPDDHPLCGGAVSRLRTRGEISCQYALFMLRWLGRPPEDFLVGPVVDVGDTRLPPADEGHRLRWDLPRLHADLAAERLERGLTWSALARDLDCSPSRLTNLRTAKQADLGLVMRITQWLGRPAARFVGAVDW